MGRHLCLALALLLLSAAPAGAAMQATQGPCRECGAYSSGTGVTYGGAFAVRVQGQDAAPDRRAGDRIWRYVPFPGTPCPAPDQIPYLEEYVLRSNPAADAVVTRFPLCLTAADFQPAQANAPPGLVALSVWRSMALPELRLSAKPGALGLVNLPSYFWASGPLVQTASVAVGASTVAVRAEAVSFEWSFGDGSPPLVSQGPGAAWPARGGVSHRYLRRGRYQVGVTTRWRGTFQIDGGPPQTVPGPPLSSTATVAYPVQELQATLTG